MTKTEEKEAKRKALKWINANRTHDGMAPLKRIEPLWWRIHGKAFAQYPEKFGSIGSARK